MTGAAAVALTVFMAPLASAQQPAPASAPLQQFTVSSDGHPLAVWARIPASPRGAMLLLHGRTWSSRPDFDLQVPGLHRSVLESLAAKGIAAYALDARGYGATPRDPSGWLTPKRAAADVAVVLRWIAARHPTLGRPALVGWSLGAATAHLAAATTPSVMSSLVLFGYAPDPDGGVAPDTDAGPPLRIKTTAAAAASDFISPKVTPAAVVKTFVQTALKTDPVAADWRHEEEFTYDASRITIPTLVMFGERDPGVDAAAAEHFFRRLKTDDKRLVVIPGADHCAHLEDTHDAWIREVTSFADRFWAKK
jgi:pimeloyl-ACP methyl ester carboxylesterase